MNSAGPIYREVQPYRQLPPFTLLVAVGTLFGWFLIIYVGILGRPLGNMDLPGWLAGAIGLPLGVLLPIAYIRLNMLTEVYSDRIYVNNGMSGRTNIPLADVTQVALRTDNIHDDYNVRNVGTIRASRIAYTVTSDNGVQLTLKNGQRYLIGSKEAEALDEAVRGAWRVVHPEAQAAEV